MSTEELTDFAPYISIPALALVVLGAVAWVPRRSVRGGVITAGNANQLYALVAR